MRGGGSIGLSTIKCMKLKIQRNINLNIEKPLHVNCGIS